jgi:hypothetical protein
VAAAHTGAVIKAAIFGVPTPVVISQPGVGREQATTRRRLLAGADAGDFGELPPGIDVEQRVIHGLMLPMRRPR